MSNQNFGLAIFILSGVFAIFFIAMLKPEPLTAEGGMVVAAGISIAMLVVQYFFRKRAEEKQDKRIKALKKRLYEANLKLLEKEVE